MRVAGMPAMVVRMTVVSVFVDASGFLAVRMPAHLRYCTRPRRSFVPFLVVIGQFDTSTPRII